MTIFPSFLLNKEDSLCFSRKIFGLMSFLTQCPALLFLYTRNRLRLLMPGMRLTVQKEEENILLAKMS